jgi:hypothetical protein
MTETKPLTAAELEEIRERCEAATSGPWHPITPTDDAPSAGVSNATTPNRHGPTFLWWPEECATRAQDRADAAFIAAARTDIPALLVTVDALRATLQELLTYTTELESRYVPMLLTHSFMLPLPDGAVELGNRIRALLGEPGDPA